MFFFGHGEHNLNIITAIVALILAVRNFAGFRFITLSHAKSSFLAGSSGRGCGHADWVALGGILYIVKFPPELLQVVLTGIISC